MEELVGYSFCLSGLGVTRVSAGCSAVWLKMQVVSTSVSGVKK